MNPRDDVALHLSPVFTVPQRIVRNSIVSNNWGPEESFGNFPIEAGSPFEFIILVEPAEFKIALNGVHFTEFRHRIPFEKITHIAVDGDVRIELLALTVDEAPITSSVAATDELKMNPNYGYGAPPYPGAGGPPYPPTGPPYPTNESNPYPPLYPSLGFPPPDTSAPYPNPYPPPPSNVFQQPAYDPTNQCPYQQHLYDSVGYNQPQGGYPPPPPDYQQSGYPQGGYPSQDPYYAGGSNVPPPPPGYQGQKKNKGGIGGMLGTALAGVTGGAAASSLGSRFLGNKKAAHHYPGHKHKSSGLPIGKIAAGVGAAALGTALLAGPLNPVS